MSILFLLLGIMLVNFCNPGAIDEAQLSKTMYFLYNFIGFAVYIFPVPILLKYNKAKDKKDRSLLVVALTLIVYDLFNLLFIKLNDLWAAACRCPALFSLSEMEGKTLAFLQGGRTI